MYENISQKDINEVGPGVTWKGFLFKPDVKNADLLNATILKGRLDDLRFRKTSCCWVSLVHPQRNSVWWTRWREERLLPLFSKINAFLFSFIKFPE